MTPLLRLDRIAGGHGWLGDDVPVLPLYFREDRYIQGAVTFVNSLHPHLIDSRNVHDSEAPSRKRTRRGLTKFDPKAAERVEADIDEHRVTSLDGVVGCLERLYSNVGNTRLIKFSSFEDWVRDLALK